MKLLQTAKGNDNENGGNRSEFWYGKRQQDQHDSATIWIRKVSEERIKNNGKWQGDMLGKELPNYNSIQ